MSEAAPKARPAKAEDDDIDVIMQKQKDKLLKQREEVEVKRASIDEELAGIDQKLSRIESYFNPAPPMAAREPVTRKPRTPSASTGTRAPRGEHRSKITALLAENTGGLSGGELIDKLGVRGDKAATQAVANALSNMKKGGELRVEGSGKGQRYFPKAS